MFVAKFRKYQETKLTLSSVWKYQENFTLPMGHNPTTQTRFPLAQ
jgi:hypothetical protein